VSISTELGEFPIAKALRSRIFKIPLLPQEQIAERFQALDSLLRPVCLDLLQVFPSVRNHYRDILARIVSGNTQGKNFFDKLDLEDGTRAEPNRKGILKESELRLLKSAFRLFRLEDPGKFADVVERAGFLRGVHEGALEGFLALSLPYRSLLAARTKALQEQNLDLLRIDASLEAIEEELGFRNREVLTAWINKAELTWKRYTQCRDELIQPYFRLVYTIAQKYSTSDSQTLDNFQNGCFGLVRAVQCYTPSRFAAFSVVAESWVKQQILFHLKNEVNFIKLPIASWNLFQKLDKVRTHIESDPEFKTSEASYEQIATHSGIPLDKVRKAYENAKLIKVFSLNAPTQNEENNSISPSAGGGGGARWNLESIAAESNPLEELELKTKTERILRIAEQFDSEERRIFGLMSGVLDIVEIPDMNPLDLWKELVRQKAASVGLGVNFK
jgi:RNA polymerase sigma factor (sigma-70 family)